MRRARPIAAAFALAFALNAAAAEARPVESKLAAEIFGVVDRQATVTYYFSGQVGAAGLTFGCMERRTVVLIRVEKGGHQKRVVSAQTSFFGGFNVILEKRLQAIPGHYYARVKPRLRHTKKERLRCLAARTPAFLVQLPPGLTSAPVVQGV